MNDLPRSAKSANTTLTNDEKSKHSQKKEESFSRHTQNDASQKEKTKIHSSAPSQEQKMSNSSRKEPPERKSKEKIIDKHGTPPKTRQNISSHQHLAVKKNYKKELTENERKGLVVKDLFTSSSSILHFTLAKRFARENGIKSSVGAINGRTKSPSNASNNLTYIYKGYRIRRSKLQQRIQKVGYWESFIN